MNNVHFLQVLKLVELNGIRDALVGIPGRSGLSVEQRKRLTIAVELVANPSIIFMSAAACFPQPSSPFSSSSSSALRVPLPLFFLHEL